MELIFSRPLPQIVHRFPKFPETSLFDRRRASPKMQGCCPDMWTRNPHWLRRNSAKIQHEPFQSWLSLHNHKLQHLSQLLQSLSAADFGGNTPLNDFTHACRLAQYVCVGVVLVVGKVSKIVQDARPPQCASVGLERGQPVLAVAVAAFGRSDAALAML